MRKPSALLGLVLPTLLLAGGAAWACGDKLMLVMGAGSLQIRSLHPASILVYPGQSSSAALIRSLEAQPAIRKAGHRFQLLEDSAGLGNALRAGKYDLVVADVSDANEFSRQVSLVASRPIVLPVAFRASKQEQSAALKKYHCLLKAPDSPDNYLDAIDHAMELRRRGANR